MTFQVFCLKQAIKKWGNSSVLVSCFFLFLKTEATLAFFHSEANFPFCKHDQEIIPSGLQIDLSQIFNILILIILWPWALFGLRYLIIFKISYVENSTVKSNWHVFLLRTDKSFLLLLTRDHCLVKKPLKSSAFFLKFLTNLPLCKRWNTTFFLFRKVFNVDQYNFGLILPSNSVLDRRE